MRYESENFERGRGQSLVELLWIPPACTMLYETHLNYEYYQLGLAYFMIDNIASEHSDLLFNSL